MPKAQVMPTELMPQEKVIKAQVTHTELMPQAKIFKKFSLRI